MIKDPNCVFCKIVAGKIPANIIYEDGQFLAFLDITPFTKGHTLLIPKSHYRFVWDVPNLDKMILIGQKIVKKYQSIYEDQLVAGLIWGKDVRHAHLQILPDTKDLHLNWTRLKLTPEEFKQLEEKLKVD